MLEYRIIHPDGQVRWVQDRENPTLNEAGELIQLDGVAVDVTDRRQAEEKIKQMVFTDDLTGLANRRLLKQDLEDLVAASPEEFSAVVMVIDLDRFKYINDTLGHTSGDRVLRRVARRLNGYLSALGRIYRPGGDEFIVILPGMGRQQAGDTAEEILRLFDKPIRLDDRELYLTPSIGISVFPQDGCDVDSLVKKADMAMYKAKESGDSYCFPSEMEEVYSQRLRLENDLRRALEEEQFELYYQPKYNLKSREVVSAEALIRWHHPEHGMVSPGAFIPVAEETRLIIPMSRWVLRTAIRQAKEWQNKGQALRVAVNVSVHQFESEKIVDEVLNMLREHDLDPCYLELEITEGIYMKNIESTIHKLVRLREAGVHISIDDFGTGFSSLQYLQRLPITALKIDKSFLDDLSGAVSSSPIITGIISMARSLQLGVVAEGVETEEQVAYLSANDCHEIQGYFFSRPLPAEQFESFVQEQLMVR